MDCSLPGSSFHGISQARILEWVAIFFSRGYSWPRNWTYISCIEGRFFTAEPTGKPSLGSTALKMPWVLAFGVKMKGRRKFLPENTERVTLNLKLWLLHILSFGSLSNQWTNKQRKELPHSQATDGATDSDYHQEILYFCMLSLCMHARPLQLYPTVCDPTDYSPPGSCVQWYSPGKNTGMGCPALFQGWYHYLWNLQYTTK